MFMEGFIVRNAFLNLVILCFGHGIVVMCTLPKRCNVTIGGTVRDAHLHLRTSFFILLNIHLGTVGAYVSGGWLDRYGQ